jgi:hypothetical protein
MLISSTSQDWAESGETGSPSVVAAVWQTR